MDPFSDAYQVIAVLGGVDCAPIACTISFCGNVGLTATFGVVEGLTAADLSWTPPPEAESIEVRREGDLLTPTPLEGTATSFHDPNVDSIIRRTTSTTP